MVENRSRSLPTIRWNRLNRRLEPAADIARIILEDASLELDDGARVGTAFTIEST